MVAVTHEEVVVVPRLVLRVPFQEYPSGHAINSVGNALRESEFRCPRGSMFNSDGKTYTTVVTLLPDLEYVREAVWVPAELVGGAV